MLAVLAATRVVRALEQQPAPHLLVEIGECVIEAIAHEASKPVGRKIGGAEVRGEEGSLKIGHDDLESLARRKREGTARRAVRRQQVGIRGGQGVDDVVELGLRARCDRLDQPGGHRAPPCASKIPSKSVELR